MRHVAQMRCDIRSGGAAGGDSDSLAPSISFSLMNLSLFLQHCSTLSRHHSTERRNARIGLPPTTTKIGLVCDDGRMRAATCRQHRLSRQANKQRAVAQREGSPFLLSISVRLRKGVQRGKCRPTERSTRGRAGAYPAAARDVQLILQRLHRAVRHQLRLDLRVCTKQHSSQTSQMITNRPGGKEAHSR